MRKIHLRLLMFMLLGVASTASTVGGVRKGELNTGILSLLSHSKIFFTPAERSAIDRNGKPIERPVGEIRVDGGPKRQIIIKSMPQSIHKPGGFGRRSNSKELFDAD